MEQGNADSYGVEVKEQDRWLPIANVARVMKGALPENAKIAKEAKECMQESVSEFVSFITSEAVEKCGQEKRKTVDGEDILSAMTRLSFENYAEALKIYLRKYRETNNACNDSQPVNRGGDLAPDGYAADPSAQMHIPQPTAMLLDPALGSSGGASHNGAGQGPEK